MGGDEHLHNHSSTSRTGEGHGYDDYDCTANDTDHNPLAGDKCQSLLASTGLRSHLADEEDVPPVSREPVVHSRHHCRKNEKACQAAAMTTQTCQPPPPRTNRITGCQLKISRHALIIITMALRSTTLNSHPFTSVNAMDSPPIGRSLHGLTYSVN